MVTTPAARNVPGRTKFVPCTTSAGPANSSTGGKRLRFHAARSARAGTGIPAAVTPCGSTRRSFRQPRSVNATPRERTSGIEASSSDNETV